MKLVEKINKHIRKKRLEKFLKRPYRERKELLFSLNDEEYQYLLNKGDIDELYERLLKIEEVLYKQNIINVWNRGPYKFSKTNENLYFHLYFNGYDVEEVDFFSKKEIDRSYALNIQPYPFIKKSEIYQIYEYLIVKQNYKLEKFKFHPDPYVRSFVARKKEYFEFFLENEEHPEVIEQLAANNYKFDELLAQKKEILKQVILSKGLEPFDGNFLKKVAEQIDDDDFVKKVNEHIKEVETKRKKEQEELLKYEKERKKIDEYFNKKVW